MMESSSAVLNALSQLPGGCRDWLLFESGSSKELGVEYLAKSYGYHTEDRAMNEYFSVCPPRNTQSSPLPLLVPEFDSPEYVIGHCFHLTVLDFNGMAQALAGLPFAKLIGECRRVEQRFALARVGHVMHLVMSTLFDNGSFVLTQHVYGTGAVQHRSRCNVWACLRGDLHRPEFCFVVDTSGLCELHRAVNGFSPVREAGSPFVCTCADRYDAPLSLDCPKDDSLWQTFQRHADKIWYSGYRLKTYKFILNEYVDGGSTALSIPVRELQTIGCNAILDGTRLQQLKVEYVQARLESMLCSRSWANATAATYTRRFGALLRSSCSRARTRALLEEEGGSGHDESHRLWNVGLEESRVEYCSGGQAMDLHSSAELASMRSTTPEEGAAHESYSSEGKLRECCTMCGGTFARKSELDRHIKSTHFQEKRHPCDRCGRSFYQRAHLLIHTQEVHEGVRNFRCNLCERGFGTNAKLKRHVKIVHLRERPHACDTCGGTFSQRSDLNRHIRLQHPAVYVDI